MAESPMIGDDDSEIEEVTIEALSSKSLGYTEKTEQSGGHLTSEITKKENKKILKQKE